MPISNAWGGQLFHESIALGPLLQDGQGKKNGGCFQSKGIEAFFCVPSILTMPYLSTKGG